MKFDPPYKPSEVRDLYARGTWAYALGKSAQTHKRWKEALARAQKLGFNPWWIRNHSDVEAVLAGCYMDEKAGRAVVNFFPLLRHFSGAWAGKPFELVDFQKYDIYIPRFGWKRPNGFRRFRRGHEEVPKKNAKSTSSAGEIAYYLIGDDEPGAEIYSAAVNRDQAGIIYRFASECLKASPVLGSLVDCIDSRKRIVYRETASFYQSLSADVPSQEGKEAHAVIVDESHVLVNGKMYTTLRYAGAARRQPWFGDISTAGVYDPSSIGWEIHEYARRVLDAEGPEKDWSFFAYIAGLSKDEEEKWAEPEMAVKSNPMMGIIINPEEDAEAVLEAQNKPSKQNEFKRYRRNIWTRQVEKWLDMDKWKECGEDYGIDELQGLRCYGGLDLSLLEDITALGLWFPQQRDLEIPYTWGEYWIAGDCLRLRDEEENGLYSLLVEQGDLRVIPGPSIDQEFVRARIKELNKLFRIKKIAYDRFAADKLVGDLKGDGLTMESIGQGYVSLNAPTKGLRDIVTRLGFRHPNNGVLNWHAANAQVSYDAAGNEKIIKGMDRGKGKGRVRFKIDAAMALIMALAASNSDPQPESVYETRGLLAI